MNKWLYLILLPFLLINCTAYKYNLPSNEGIQYLEQNQVFKNIVLGIDSDTKYGNLINDDSLAVYTPLIKVEEIISELRRRDLFKEVNFEDQLENKPDLILTGFLGEDYQFRDCMGCLITAVSLGIIPRIIRYDRTFNLTFQSLGEDDKRTVSFRTNLNYTDAAGWIFGIIRLSSTWDKKYDENNYYYSLYNELYSRKEEIISLSKVK